MGVKVKSLLKIGRRTLNTVATKKLILRYPGSGRYAFLELVSSSSFIFSVLHGLPAVPFHNFTIGLHITFLLRFCINVLSCMYMQLVNETSMDY